MSKPMNFIANGKLPDSGKRVLFFYGERNSIGFHASKHSIEIYEYEYEDEDWYDTDVNGAVYLPVGWYESSWETEQDSFISEPVIAWQEIPDFPASIDLRHTQLNELIVGMAEDDPDGTVALITGHFVGLIVSYIAQNSEGSECKDIVLEGGKRKITIHAPAPEVCAVNGCEGLTSSNENPICDQCADELSQMTDSSEVQS